MADRSATNYVRLEVGDDSDIEAVVVAFRKDGELHELVSMEPPARCTIERGRADAAADGDGTRDG
jgi:hypothetical protein